ncbi:hypothetical protein GCM10018790_45650 [Kitasatospora xanthocidica]|nr:hypothetical protein GCM10018790_45650 [Kitasatospora xanthocidica]
MRAGQPAVQRGQRADPAARSVVQFLDRVPHTATLRPLRAPDYGPSTRSTGTKGSTCVRERPV